MKILLILPKIHPSFPQKFGTGINLMPLNFPWLAAVTHENHEVRIIDENIAKIDFDQDADLVGLNALTVSAKRAYQISDIFRSKGVPTIIGGSHVSYMPSEALQYADSVIIGEAEEIWPQILIDVAMGKLKKIYKQNKKTDLSKLPLPHKHLLKRKKYSESVQAMRGCPFGCNFCSASTYFGTKVRTRPINDVVKEIEDAPPFFLFIDDNIVADPNYANKLFRVMTPFNKFWGAKIK